MRRAKCGVTAAGRKNGYIAIVIREGKRCLAIGPEVPEANGEGKTCDTCREDLAAAIETVLDYQREKSMENVPRAEQTAALVWSGQSLQ